MASPPNADDTGMNPGLSLGSGAPSTESQGTFYQKMEITFPQPVGNAIHQTVISFLLRSRKGLFIIDLDDPYAQPRFLPQGGTWEVADVQWNPHHSRSHYIVSTSSQKLLIWNLNKTGQTAIEFILNKHYRAITDINWSSYNPDVIASCGIDSWIWAWDLRAGPRTVFGMCAWDAPATQVKWNRRDEHLIASSHDDKVLIWDNRKGSLPLITIRAHQGAKIYGIDWSRKTRNEIVTCSLDKTIKFWTLDSLSPHVGDMDRLQPNPTQLYPQSEYFDFGYGECRLGGDDEPKPRAVIHTRYPVWRARHLPFGYGVLALPQRGETALEMWSPDQPEQPIHTVEGHTDVVKEYVWRFKGGHDCDHDDREFQLVTWAKDRTLRLLPMDPSILRAAGHVPGSRIEAYFARRNIQSDGAQAIETTYRLPPTAQPKDEKRSEPTVSAPMAHRGILAGVQVGGSQDAKPASTTNPSPHGQAPPLTASIRSTPDSPEQHRKLHLKPSLLSSSVHEKEKENKDSVFMGRPTLTGGFMTRGGGNSRAQPPGGLDQQMYVSGVKIERRAGSGGLDSSGPASRIASRSRAGSVDLRPPNGGEPYIGLGLGVYGPGEERGRPRGRSDSRARTVGTDQGGGEMPEHLADEIALIARKFGTRVTCERFDTTRKRTVTFTLLGPWRDDNALAFIRITFSFPKDYWKISPTDPNASRSIPSFDLDKIPSISLKTRAFLLKKLRYIRYISRPCLEPCLRFLLGEDDAAGYIFRDTLDLSEGSRSDGEEDMAAMDPNDLHDTAKRVKSTKKDNPDEEIRGRTGKDVPRPIVNTPGNSIRPRRCGGTWGPNGELVCFFLNRPGRVFSGGRGTANRRNASPSPSIVSRATSGGLLPRPFASTAGTISHAMLGLSKLANDGPKSVLPKEPEIRPRNPWMAPGIADSFFIGPVLRSITRESRDTRASSNHANRPLSSVSLKRFTGLNLLDKDLAQDYTMMAEDPAHLCQVNAEVARRHQRLDHMRVWQTLLALFRPIVGTDNGEKDSTRYSPIGEKQQLQSVVPRREHVRWGDHPLAQKAAKHFYDVFAQKRDLQMLAMLSVVLLEVDRLTPAQPAQTTFIELKKSAPLAPVIPDLSISPRINIDYFSLRPREAHHISPTTPSPSWANRRSSFTTSGSLPSPSRNSWASRFLGGDASPSLNLASRRERTISTISTATSHDGPRGYSGTTPAIPVPVVPGHYPTHPKSEVSPKRKSTALFGGLGARSSEGQTTAVRTWNEPSPGSSSINLIWSSGAYAKRLVGAGSGSSGSHGAPIPRSPSIVLLPPQPKTKKKVITVTLIKDEEEVNFYHAPFTADDQQRLVYEGHVIAYSKILHQWQLNERRLELLKYLGYDVSPGKTEVLHALAGIDEECQLDLADTSSEYISPQDFYTPSASESAATSRLASPEADKDFTYPFGGLRDGSYNVFGWSVLG
ncbi:hypothetical protein FRC05_004511 [Tulasnella sp. 425]|nr:hypothetical protein FRC05_004511 [Tulasnella sp. 425]